MFQVFDGAKCYLKTGSGVQISCLSRKTLSRHIKHLSYIPYSSFKVNQLDGVMESMLTSSAEGRGLDPHKGQTKDIKIDICCFSAKHAALRSKSKDGSAQCV